MNVRDHLVHAKSSFFVVFLGSSVLKLARLKLLAVELAEKIERAHDAASIRGVVVDAVEE